MPFRHARPSPLIAIALAATAIISACGIGDRVDFVTDVRPILSSSCLKCHGGVKQAGGISLLFREDALTPGESGRTAIVPGDADGSELMRRVGHTDPAERMPREHRCTALGGLATTPTALRLSVELAARLAASH